MSKTITEVLPKVDLNEPRYDQSTYINRCKHFFLLTNPLNLLASNAELERARQIVQKYKAGHPVPECKTIDELWSAKYLYDSAFHPETGEKSILIGRMSCQMPLNTLITGAMLSFYKSKAAVIFWQWFNQSCNAIVNYTNRSGKSDISNQQLLASYCLATGGALSTALTLNSLTQKLNPLIGRLVPFTAVAAGNCINVPMMRLKELQEGIILLDNNGHEIAKSKKAAYTGISLVVLSRIIIASPSMILTPILMEYLTKKGVLRKYPWANVPIQVAFVGFILAFSTPMGCALFRQQAEIPVSQLEPHVQEIIRKKNPDLKIVTYNKGL